MEKIEEEFLADLLNRIKHALKMKDVLPRHFAVEIGLSESYFSYARNFGITLISQLYKKFPDINLVWLLTGKGKSYPVDEDSSLPLDSGTINHFLEIISNKDQQIVNATASYAATNRLLSGKINTLEELLVVSDKKYKAKREENNQLAYKMRKMEELIVKLKKA